MNQKPLVSIGIPTFSRLACLKEAVTSALAQKYPRIEVLISDDGRDPFIADWSKSISDPRIRYWRNPENRGLAGNWNVLAAAARGDFIVIIGDDDRLLPNFLDRLMSEIHEGVDVIFSNHFIIDEQGNRLEAQSREFTRAYHRDELGAGELTDAEICVWRNSVPMSSALIRTQVAQRLRFNEILNTPEIEFFARLASRDGRFQFVPEYLAEYRVHGQSETSRGLRSEELADCLVPLKAREAAEPCKRAFLQPVLVNAVSRCLQRGDRPAARRFLGSDYYPGPPWKSIRGIVQTICATLPAFLGCPLYRVIAGAKSQFDS